MKKWYIVKSKFYDNGKIVANITGEIESEEQPTPTEESTLACDIYVDYFATEKEAIEFCKEALTA
jgi:hypothetical protein